MFFGFLGFWVLRFYGFLGFEVCGFYDFWVLGFKELCHAVYICVCVYVYSVLAIVLVWVL